MTSASPWLPHEKRPLIPANSTHATAVPTRLVVETANHFYTVSKGNCICLELSRLSLMAVGSIITMDEEGLRVGEHHVVSNDALGGGE